MPHSSIWTPGGLTQRNSWVSGPQCTPGRARWLHRHQSVAWELPLDIPAAGLDPGKLTRVISVWGVAGVASKEAQRSGLESPAKARDKGSTPGSGRYLGGGNGNPLWWAEEESSGYLAWESPWTEEPGGLQSMGVTKSLIRLSGWARVHTHLSEKSRGERLLPLCAPPPSRATSPVANNKSLLPEGKYGMSVG